MSDASGSNTARPLRRGSIVRAPADLLAGGLLVVLSLSSLWVMRHLDGGTLRAMGPGFFPRLVAAALGVAGALLVAFALLRDGPPLRRWALRGPIFVTLAVVAFALTIRTVGLAVAGPLVVILGGAASPESRPRELVVFALVLTAACILLFRVLLTLPIPVLSLPGILTL